MPTIFNTLYESYLKEFDLVKEASSDDAKYFEAINAKDMETVQKMVDEKAKLFGYVDSDHRMAHEAPNREDTNFLDIRSSGIVPKDYWTNPQWYQTGQEEMESFHNVLTAFRIFDNRIKEGRSTASVGLHVYRAVPKDVKETQIRNGDWVTPSKQYAKNEGAEIKGGFRIIFKHALLKDLWWDGNSIAEFGYDDGKRAGYKNTRNNKKLLDPITYDHDGKIIPLSKRFNPKNSDPRY